MWNTIANFRDNLSQIASEVLDTAEELEIGTSSRDANDEESSSPVKDKLHSIRSQADRNKSNSQGDLPHRFRRPYGRRNSEVDGATNGISSHHEPGLEELQMKCQNLETRGKELFGKMQAKEWAYAELDEKYQKAASEAEKLKAALAKTQQDLTAANSRLQKEVQSAEIARRDCLQLKEENAKLLASVSASESKEAAGNDQSMQEIEGSRDETIARLQETLLIYEKERSEFQAEREHLRKSLETKPLDDAVPPNDLQKQLKEKSEQVDELFERLKASEREFVEEKAELTRRLEAVTLEKDKATSNLSRLKQHLLEKENADSEKMDRDSEQIAMLEVKASASNARVLQLEQALAQAVSAHAETSKKYADELDKKKAEIESLQQKLTDCFAALDSKETEVANLQSILGQYYAESDAKERLEDELRKTRDDVRKLSAALEAAQQLLDAKDKEREELLDKQVAAERNALSFHAKLQKAEQDMARMRHALEESMIRLNRMSSDSDYSVDRRLVIKLLVTYFERSHSREVLDLMARILGFSDDDKRRVGLARQNAGKPGVVRSVLGLPGRVVGGLLSSGEPAATGDSTPRSSSGINQSFTDLWIDFLLKESEERDRKEREESETKAADASQAGNEQVASTDGPMSSNKASSWSSIADQASNQGHRRALSETADFSSKLEH